MSYNPTVAWTAVWADPLSLATTQGMVSFPGVTKMFQFTPFPLQLYVFKLQCQGITLDGFPHSEILGYSVCTQLPEAYRSVPRPSSAFGAKASTVRP